MSGGMSGARRYRRGAASFYIVAIATLILAVVATSFAMVVIAEVTRSSNDELAQSAYDSAMAGVEDAKLAFLNYQKCIANGAYEDAESDGPEVTCQDIVYYMNHPSCDMVGWILGRVPKGVSAEVAVGGAGDGSSGSGGGGSGSGGVGGDSVGTGQAYTCVKIDLSLSDYRSRLTGANVVRVVKADLDGILANDVKKVRFSWYLNNDTDEVANYLNVVPNLGAAEFETQSRVAFLSAGATGVAVPPVVALQLIQTNETFKLSDFDVTGTEITNRATMYLVPTNDSEVAASGLAGNYLGVGTKISAKQIAKTNDRTASNLPMVVDCSGEGEFACSVELELPRVVGAVSEDGSVSAGVRNNETFRLVVGLPYAQVDTDFSVEFLCDEGVVCSKSASDGGDSDGASGSSAGNIANLSGAQVKIDATGRANDMYRRVEVRLEAAGSGLDFPYYAVQLNGADEEGYSLIKDLTVIWNE